MIEMAKAPKPADKKDYRYLLSALVVGIAMLGSSCTPKEAADAQPQQANRPTAVDISISRTEALTSAPTYTGSTEPIRTVSLRSQVEGQLLGLNVDVGDFVKQGQIVAQLDDSILRTQLNAAEAELAALRSEVARSNSQVSNARAQVESARLELAQAQADSQRQQSLLREGAIASQTAQQSQTAARTAAQTLRAAQEQVTTEQQAVAAAQGRVVAQQAVVAQEQKRRSYTRLVAPISGLVLQRLQEPGDLIQPGNEVLQIADFSRIQVRVEVSDKELGNISIGQSISVKLDAFPQETLNGQVTRIYPAADVTARLVPIEVVIPNSNGRIGSGLLARVSFINSNQESVVVPQSALAGQQQQGGGEQEESKTGTVFVVTEEAESKAKVVARPVTLGDRADGKVEVISGLKVGERYVSRSSKPLKNGETVNISILSRTAPKGQ
ncbi:efflux RND transporter periplasmic adaptor subunit [Synechocystis sp. PCC 7509]|uniref:efflux RND transporter periplasmic adaptor subunit n=1 Tax=Synechocystis sp. PCC 7509 TaxID=927677 RepID=UPI0002F3ECFD|nr:efflux RND transporter periplasmic adaptor subunit [Synechocystis sp. PCC 7509]